MKCISLWQPHASLIGHGKTIESRSWPTKYRGLLAIHAAKKVLTPCDLLEFGGEFWDAYAKTGLGGKANVIALPHGCIIAVANLVACVSTNTVLYRPRIFKERLFGDYSVNRFAWILEDIKALKTPIPFRGMQGLFEVPDELLSGE